MDLSSKIIQLAKTKSDKDIKKMLHDFETDSDGKLLLNSINFHL